MINPFSLEGHTIVVTGASRGIGRQIAITASQMGARLIITGRDEARLHETLAALEGCSHQLIVADLSDRSKRDEFVAQLPMLDGIVHSAGVAPLRPFKYSDEQTYDECFPLNFEAPFMITQRLAKKKRFNKGCSIVFISSLAGKGGGPGLSIYAASKSAMTGAMLSMSHEMVKHGIRVNSVSPGMVNTGMADELVDTVAEDLVQADIARYPLGYGTPEDVAYAVIYLLSKASKWVSGTDLVTNGGRI